jgi:hypothetical protein
MELLSEEPLNIIMDPTYFDTEQFLTSTPPNSIPTEFDNQKILETLQTINDVSSLDIPDPEEIQNFDFQILQTIFGGTETKEAEIQHQHPYNQNILIDEKNQLENIEKEEVIDEKPKNKRKKESSEGIRKKGKKESEKLRSGALVKLHDLKQLPGYHGGINAKSSLQIHRICEDEKGKFHPNGFICSIIVAPSRSKQKMELYIEIFATERNGAGTKGEKSPLSQFSCFAKITKDGSQSTIDTLNKALHYFNIFSVSAPEITGLNAFASNWELIRKYLTENNIEIYSSKFVIPNEIKQIIPITKTKLTNKKSKLN